MLDGEVAEELSDVVFAHLGGMAFFVEEDETANPIKVGLLGAQAVALDPKMPADAIEQLGSGGRWLWGSDHEIKYGGGRRKVKRASGAKCTR